MKTQLKIILAIQIFCSFLWLIHTGFLKDQHATNMYERGKLAGREDLYGELILKKETIPDDVFLELNKHLQLDLEGEFQENIVFNLAIFLQFIALIILIHAVCRGGVIPKNET